MSKKRITLVGGVLWLRGFVAQDRCLDSWWPLELGKESLRAIVLGREAASPSEPWDAGFENHFGSRRKAVNVVPSKQVKVVDEPLEFLLVGWILDPRRLRRERTPA
jgi:hypothetical protein